MSSSRYIVNVEGAVIEDGSYLLIERAATEDHAAGTIGFPGGTVEVTPGHSAPIEATARRELKEEVGITVEDVTYVLSRSFRDDNGVQCLNIVTRCDRVSGEPTPEEPEEVADVHWMSPDEIQDHPNAPTYLERDVAVLEADHQS